MQRSLLHLTKKDKIRTKVIQEKLKTWRVEEEIKKLKFKWAGHAMRLNHDRWTKILTEWVPLERKRNRGRQKKRWSDEIKMECGHLWTRFARDRIKWKNIVKEV